VLKKMPLARRDVNDWVDDWRRGVNANGWPDYALGVVGGKCTKEVGNDGKHLDGNPHHNNPKMEVYGTMDVYWD
jgi:hypothetical protein